MKLKKVYFDNFKSIDAQSYYFADWCFEDPKNLSLKNLNKINKNLNKNYHWLNKTKLKRDQKYLQKLTAELFQSLVKKINLYHKSNYNYDYWKVIIFPWLVSVTDCIFDKWEMLKKIENKKKFQAITFQYKDEDFITRNYKDFSLSDKNFNLWIISKALEFKNNIKYSKKLKLKGLNKNLYLQRGFVKDKIYDFINLNKRKKKNFLFNNIGLNFRETLKLYLKLKSKPFFWTPIFYSSQKPNIKKRTDIFNYQLKDKKFLSFLQSILNIIIPKSYLEDFNNIQHKLKKKYDIQKFDYIFTATEYKKNDEFKIFVAEQILKGSKFICIQHGGTYGIVDFDRELDIIYSISNKFLTTGWRDNQLNVTPFTSLFLRNKLKRSRIKKFDVSIIYHAQTKIPYRLSGTVKTNYQRLKIMYNFKSLINRLVKNHNYRICFRYQKKIVSQFSNFNEKYFLNTVEFDRGEKNILKLYANSKLIITDTLSTTFFECMIYNIPIIILIDKEFEIVNQRFKKIYISMKKNHLVFHDEKKLYSFLAKNFDFIETLWKSKKVQEIRLDFKKNIANNNIDIAKFFKNFIK